jgi:hypothetical protein
MPRIGFFLLTILAAAPAHAADFARDVLPVLRRACLECHDADQAKGGLRLDSRDHALRGGESGPALQPGNPDGSELIRRIELPRDHPDAMPRRGEGLSAADVQSLRAWVAAGAPWPDLADASPVRHWAYLPPVKPEPPAVRRADWPRHDLDRFVLARLEREGLSPAPPAPTAVLVRRLHLALTGLPPAPEEVARLESLGDPLPTAAVDALVDRLLASPEFGVRWARPWLDLARYADSHGFQRDDLRDIWGFRDWVVDAFNADLPFDRFTIEQVAGDLLPDATPAQIIATGFHRCTPTNVEAGTEPEESRIHQVIDRVNTTGAVWLGTTLECAQCHDHKYDPFSQRDYYRLLAYFNHTEMEADRANPKVPGSIAFNGSPFPLGDGAHAPERKALETRKSQLTAELASLRQDADSGFASWSTQMRHALASPVREHALELVEFVSEEGASHSLLPDGSVLLSGPAPDKDTYRIVLRGDLRTVTGFKLEALTHDSLPGRGPGRGDASRPNFVLNTFEARLRLAAANDDPGKPLRFSAARADFSQANFDVAGAIDADPESAWAINPKFGEPHHATFTLESPVDLDPRSELVLTLVQRFGSARTLGRVRLRALTGDLDAAGLPEAIARLLTQPLESLGERDLARIREHYELAMPGLAPRQRELATIEKKLAALVGPTTEIMRELPAPRMTALFKRGDYRSPADPVQPGTPAILPPAPDGPGNRLTLARWLVAPENPLTARVTVNRWWAELFGQGLVRTVEDFGIKGDPPSHPELLDWLAVRYQEEGWSLKRLLKLIVTSATFAQDSAVSPALYARDDQNRLLARGPRFRLDAEGIRDNALAIAGLLSTEKGGPPIYPPQPEGLWRKVGGQQYPYQVSEGEARHRRGLYVVLKRGSPYPSFVNFDASARMACVVRRSRSNTPLQALTLLNDPVYVEAAAALARRLQADLPDASLDARITHGFRLALARLPSETEIAALRDLFHAQEADSGPDSAWNAVAAALLNLDETITHG